MMSAYKDMVFLVDELNFCLVKEAPKLWNRKEKMPFAAASIVKAVLELVRKTVV